MTRGLEVINEQINRFSNSSMELSLLNNSVFREQNNVKPSLERIRNIEDNIENIRKKIIMEILGISYREEILRTFYIIDNITRRISRISFGLYNLKISLLKQAKYDNDIITTIEKVKESIGNLHEMIRALIINHKNIIELIQEIQRLESRICSKDRNTLVKDSHRIENTNKLILFKDTFEAIKEKKRQSNVKKLMIYSQDLL